MSGSSLAKESLTSATLLQTSGVDGSCLLFVLCKCECERKREGKEEKPGLGVSEEGFPSHGKIYMRKAAVYTIEKSISDEIG